MPAELLGIEKAQKELNRFKKLKQKALSELPAADPNSTGIAKFLRKQIEKQIKKLDAKIAKAEAALIKATEAADLVNTGVLGEVIDVVEEVASGKPDEALDRLKDLGEEKLDDFIDEKIKDKEIAETVKDVIDRVGDGDIDGVVDVLKDGVEDKADDLIDKHVKNEKIAAVLKGVVDEALEGDWDGLLDVVKDGLVDIAEGKLEEFIQKLIDLFDAQIQIKIDFDMKEEAKVLIPKALQETKKKTGMHWTKQLAINLSKRLWKETGIIIKAEIKQLVSDDGLEILKQIAKDAAIETLKSGLLGRTIKDILKELVHHVAQHPAFKKIIKDFKRKMLMMFVRVAEEEVEKAVGPVIDAFLRVHSPWAGTLLSTGKRSLKIGPFWGCVNLALSVRADFNIKATAKRAGLGAVARAGLTGSALAGVGISLGFELPVVGGVAIEGGIQGGPVIDANASIRFSINNAVVKASVVPITLNIDMVAKLYLETPIPNHILKYVPAYLSSTSVVKQTIYYPLGRLNLITATTPSYSLTFDMVNKEYEYIGASGNYTITLNPKVKAYIKDTKEALEAAAQKVLDSLDPTEWDLNPFDDEGWIGSWF